ncbi:MAG: fibronectin type III domain-containing protein [Polyangia bacterium]
MPPNPTDPGTVSYSQVQALFDAKCSGGACHINSPSPAEGLDLSAAVAAANVINVPASQDSKRNRITPGQPDASYLLCKVDPACSPIVGARMPLGVPLTAPEIALLRAWISQGASGGGPVPDGGAPSDFAVPGDQTPPVFAGATRAVSAPNSVTLSWGSATDDRSAAANLTYLIYQATSAGGETYAAPTYTTAPGATSFAVGKLAINTTYYFVVRARDEAGNIDGNTVEVSAKTPAISDTQAPTFAGLTSATATSTDITLSWSAASDNVSAAADLVYSIYQATAAGTQMYSTPTYTTAPGVTSYKISGLLPNTTYYFVVRARDAAGNIDANTVERSAKTGGVSLSGQVQPIFLAKCATNACHSGARPAQGLSLGSAAATYAGTVNVASTECTANKLVLPNQPDQSYLIWKLQGSGPCFMGSQMPKGQPLSAAEITTVRSWILSGAPNN